jgi:hypothetical protein
MYLTLDAGFCCKVSYKIIGKATKKILVPLAEDQAAAAQRFPQQSLFAPS